MWDDIYRELETSGLDPDEERAGTAWLDPFWHLLGEPRGKMLDVGCGLGADMARFAAEGWRPVGIDLEARATGFVGRTYGFPAYTADIRCPLPFDDETFNLASSRFAIHFLPPGGARDLFRELRRVLRPEGRLIFAVNSQEHRRLGLQYDYTDAFEREADYWHLPTLDRTYLFYSTRLAKRLLGSGWRILHLGAEPFEHWGIEKHAVLCVAEKAGTGGLPS
ncbi:MAG: class I SAM-dependent methyltransferase [Actinomycetota bacterium]|jgi:SAM-dependent methyltransferase|nr:class I SAM-dependent methyltransferase [Actinomycetota bacterium]MDQ3428368.1 class I SAM-dependent methyltransferase [Actinomycetota bacterium]